MIKLFNSTDTSYLTNGDKIIIPTKAKIHKEDNGAYYLDLETNLSYVNDIVQDKIIVAPTPQGEQAFRIGNVEKTKSKLKSKCYHIYYDSENYVISDSYVVDKDCNDALDHLNSATDNTSPFKTTSNITTIKSFRCVRKSLYEAINTVIERWGGHLVRDNWNIQIMDKIGQDNGITVRYAKNLKDITCTENWDNVVTKILPVGKDGILLDNLYIVSETQYGIPYTKTISFEQDLEREDYSSDESYTQALKNDLQIQAQAYLDEHCIPELNYTLKANIDKVTDIGDTIEVQDERLNLDIMTNIIAYDYDCILGQYTELEFGNFKKKLSNLMGNISSSTQQQIQSNNDVIQVAFNESLQQAQDKIMGVLGSSYVIYDADKILVVDTLPKEDARNVIMISSGGIGFSSTGISGTFRSAWTIDNILNMENINVINLTASLIKGGTLKLGSNLNQNGQLEIYDETNTLIGEMNKNGLKMYGLDGSYVLLNNQVGFAGYDRLGNQIYWVNKDEFHMKKSVIEEEITLCNKLRFIPITIKDSDGNITNDGIGLVSVVGGED